MSGFLQILNVAVYLGLTYLVAVAFIWLITRNEPDLWTVRDLALKPVQFLLSPFGIRFTPQASRPSVRQMVERERRDEASVMTRSTNQFRTIRAAVEYLVGRIVAEAEREGISLTDVERKMLYLSETDWTLPGIMDVNAEFERDYDDASYEEKIAGVVRNLLERATPEEQQTWDDAVLKLCDGDHYLLVLIDAAGPAGRAGDLRGKIGAWLPSANGSGRRPRDDFSGLSSSQSSAAPR